MLAHQAREIAQHLKRISMILEHYPVDREELERYGNVLRIFDALTRSRSRLEEPPRKMAGEPFTLAELQNGWVNPLGELWASWTQIVNRTERASDREATTAVVHTLRALRIAFWPSEAPTPTPRDPRATAFLGKAGTLARRYLRAMEENIVIEKPEAVRWLLRRLAREMRAPFFVWTTSPPEEAGARQLPTEPAIMEAAEKLATSLLESLTDGYGLSALKADLPPDCAEPGRRTAVRDVIAKQMREGEFDPGPTIEDSSRSRATARNTLRKVMGALGHPRVKSLFDADRSAARGSKTGADSPGEAPVAEGRTYLPPPRPQAGRRP